MLPRMATPSAPPNSELVSEIAEAAPARSCGALPTIKSVASVKTGAMPSDMMIAAGTTSGKAGVFADLGQEREADCGEYEAAGEDEGGAKSLREKGRHQRADDEGDRGGRGPEAGLERREAEHQLQILCEEDENAEDDEGREQISAERYAEGREPEQAADRSSGL